MSGTGSQGTWVHPIWEWTNAKQSVTLGLERWLAGACKLPPETCPPLPVLGNNTLCSCHLFFWLWRRGQASLCPIPPIDAFFTSTSLLSIDAFNFCRLLTFHRVLASPNFLLRLCALALLQLT